MTMNVKSKWLLLAAMAAATLIAAGTTVLGAGSTQTVSCQVQAGSQCFDYVTLQAGEQVNGTLTFTNGPSELILWIGTPNGHLAYTSGLIYNGTQVSFVANMTGSFTVHFDDTYDQFDSTDAALTYEVAATTVSESTTAAQSSGSPAGSSITIPVAVVAMAAVLAVVGLFVVRVKRSRPKSAGNGGGLPASGATAVLSFTP